jgi:hypothetical protein
MVRLDDRRRVDDRRNFANRFGTRRFGQDGFDRYRRPQQRDRRAKRTRERLGVLEHVLGGGRSI